MRAISFFRFAFVFTLSISSLCTFSAEKRDILRVRCDENYPPFQYVATDGRPAGFDIDIMNALATVLGWKIEIKASPWYEMASSLGNDEADLIPGMYVKPERELTYELSNPILVSSHSFFIRKNEKIRSFNDLLTTTDSLDIIIYNSQVLKNYLESISGKYHITYVEDNLQGLQLLASGKGDAMLLPKRVGIYLADIHHLTNIKPVGLPVLPRDYVMAAMKGNVDLIQEVNKGLSIIQETGEYDSIYKKWFGKYESDKDIAKWFRVVLVVVGIVFLLLILIIVSNWILRKQVNKQTLELNKKISELDSIQKLLQFEKDNAVKTDRLKSAFLANMSHEIRTPMNAIIGFAELLSDPGVTQTERDYYAGLIGVNSGMLLNLINDIIDISKIEAHQLPLRIESIEPHVLLSDMFPVFQNEMKSRNKDHLVLSYEPDLAHTDTVIQTDPHRFRQVITNLVVNAIKFTIEGYICYGFLEPDDQMLTFFVKDSGPGIPEDKRAIIFDRFQQLEQGKHHRQHGAGLGLSITHGLISLMGGALWVESEEGKGSTFFFTLPLGLKNTK